MSTRLNKLLEHIAIKDEDSEELRCVKQNLALATLSTQFTMGSSHLKQSTKFMIHEMVEGLEGRPSTVRMLPSFIYKSNPSKATGIFYALDLGGTNFRVIRVELNAGKIKKSMDSKFLIPISALQGKADDLFNFIAQSVRKMIVEKSPNDLTKTMPLGFTFSFPCNQLSVNSGTLINWTKGFSTKGVEGHDVVELLKKSLNRYNIKMNVVALCNDTIGTLVARYFIDENAQVGIIVGTGSNACYFERSSAVTKNPEVSAHGDLMTPINMECGNFDSKYKFVLPITKYDEEMDEITLNKGKQSQEKIVSGMYLGELARRVIVHLSSIGCLDSKLGPALKKPWSFESKYMGMISADQMPGLQFTRLMIERVSGVNVSLLSDLHVIRDVCRLVRNRSAQQTAVFTSAPLLKTHTHGLATVAVDGSVYEWTPSFRRIYRDNVNTILGNEADVQVVLQKDGSGIGATMIAALVTASS